MFQLYYLKTLNLKNPILNQNGTVLQAHLVTGTSEKQAPWVFSNVLVTN